jgi:hypothetical protein
LRTDVAFVLSKFARYRCPRATFNRTSIETYISCQVRSILSDHHALYLPSFIFIPPTGRHPVDRHTHSSDHNDDNVRALEWQVFWIRQRAYLSPIKDDDVCLQGDLEHHAKDENRLTGTTRKWKLEHALSNDTPPQRPEASTHCPIGISRFPSTKASQSMYNTTRRIPRTTKHDTLRYLLHCCAWKPDFLYMREPFLYMKAAMRAPKPSTPA